tara:strand:+ start:416 stop:1327 length:912 start_codon:yes stop_codon:yes gene_type:complete
MKSKVDHNFFLLIIAILIGVSLIIYELLNESFDQLSLEASKSVATVNGESISEEQFLKYAINLGANIDSEDDINILELLLERMIEEELLVQRGIELSLHKNDIEVRKTIIQQVIAFIIQVEDAQPDEEELINYFQKNINKYKPTELIHVNSIFVESNNEGSILLGSEYDFKSQKDLFDKIYSQLNFKSFSEVKNEFNQPQIVELPNKTINLKDCRLYLNNKVCNEIILLENEEISQPIFYQNGYFIFQMIEKKHAEIDGNFFEKVRDKVLFDYLNQKDDQKLIDYIKYLKNNADIKKYSLNPK